MKIYVIYIYIYIYIYNIQLHANVKQNIQDVFNI